MEKPDLILPVVHLNGTSREALVEQRTDVARKLREALEAMCQACPNGRDYYPDPGRLQKAQVQHERRVGIVRGLLEEVMAEAEAIMDLEGGR